MSYQDRLLHTLSDVYSVQRTGHGGFLLHSRGRATELIADEADVAARTKMLAPDGLAVLGAVGGDASGETAAMGLLAIHIEETIESDESVTRVVVHPDGITWEH